MQTLHIGEYAGEKLYQLLKVGCSRCQDTRPTAWGFEKRARARKRAGLPPLTLAPHTAPAWVEVQRSSSAEPGLDLVFLHDHGGSSPDEVARVILLAEDMYRILEVADIAHAAFGEYRDTDPTELGWLAVAVVMFDTLSAMRGERRIGLCLELGGQGGTA